MNKKKKDFSLKLYIYISKKDGSALVFVMLTIAILAILGTVLVSMSMVNMRMKRSGIIIKQNKYYSESGIDQVYAKVSDEVVEAISKAEREVDNGFYDNLGKLKLILAHEEPVEIKGIKNDGTEYVVETIMVNMPSKCTSPDFATYKKYLDEHGAESYTINYAELKKTSKEKFEKIFKKHIVDNINETFVKNAVTVANPKVEETKIDVPSFTPAFVNEGGVDIFHINDITSTVTYKKNVVKTVQVDMAIKVPDKIFKTDGIEEVDIVDNPIWQQAIVATENIDVSGKVKAKGSVFGLGTKAAQSWNARNFGGVRVDNLGSLIVDGDLISRQYVQLSKSAANASLMVTGLVHANTLITQAGSNGSINVGGNVYTTDDLELNGDYSHILIDGNYYGYWDKPDAGVEDHDTSSAIVINATKDTASLTINGKNKNGFDGWDVLGTKKNGSVIKGLSYIEFIDNRDKKYKTGESVSFSNNTFVYAWDFNTDLSDFEEEGAKQTLEKMVESSESGFLTEGQYKCLSPAQKKIAVENGFFADHENYKDSDGLVTIEGHSSAEVKGVDDKQVKQAYFLAFQRYVDSVVDNPLFRGGNEAGPKVKIDKYVSTTGLRLSGGEFNLGSDKAAEVNNYQNPSLKNKATKKFGNDYISYLTRLRGFDESKDSAYDVNDMKTVIKDADPVAKLAKSASLGASHIENEDGVVRCLSAADRLEVYCGASADAKYKDPSADVDSLYLTSNTHKGVIFCKGDIVFKNAGSSSARTDFNGTVISNENIVFESGVDVKIINNEATKNALAAIIHGDSKLKNFFETAEATSLGNGKIKFAPKSKLEEVAEFNKIQNYDKFISLSDWQVVENATY